MKNTKYYSMILDSFLRTAWFEQGDYPLSRAQKLTVVKKLKPIQGKLF